MSNIIIPEAYTKTFSRGFDLVAQKKTARMKIYARTKKGSGDSITHNTLDDEEMEETTGQRMPSTVLSEAGGEIRNCFPRKFRKALGQDQYDETLLGETVLSSSDIFQTLAAGYERKCDSVFIDGITGTNKVGANGGTDEGLHADNVVAVDYVRTGAAADSNLTSAKLRYAKLLFEENEYYGQNAKMPGAKLCCAITARMKDALLDDDLVTDADKTRINKWDDGDILYWNGIHFIRDENVPVNASNADVKNAVMWVSSHVMFCPWNDLRTRISERADKDYAIQYYAGGQMGAMRLEQKAVATIACETTL